MAKGDFLGIVCTKGIRPETVEDDPQVIKLPAKKTFLEAFALLSVTVKRLDPNSICHVSIDKEDD